MQNSVAENPALILQPSCGKGSHTAGGGIYDPDVLCNRFFDADPVRLQRRTADLSLRANCRGGSWRGVRTGSSVIEVRSVVRTGLPGPEQGGTYRYVAGEAVAVDLPNGETLFAVLTGNGTSTFFSPEYIVEMVSRDHFSKKFGRRMSANDAQLIAKLADTRLKAELPAKQMPAFVIFDDLSRPSSVRELVVSNFADNLGEGYRLSKVIVETTQKPIVYTIGGRLKWLRPAPEPSLDPTHAYDDFSAAATLTHGDFWRHTQ